MTSDASRLVIGESFVREYRKQEKTFFLFSGVVGAV